MIAMKLSLIVTVICCLFLITESSSAENWTEFHTESWSFYSEKLRKKLNFKNYFYYDADRLRRGKNDGLQVWVKEISANDRFYVGKGDPEKEISFRQLKLWCEKRKFIVFMGESDFELDESLGAEINPGTQYAMLYDRLCRK